MNLTESVKEYVKSSKDELERLIYELCQIPAPSHNEGRRAEYCKAWFAKNRMTEAYVDEALNVIFPYQADGSQNLTVFVAHTDTVFPDLEPMPYSDDGRIIRSPGVGDDTASLAALMLVAKYFVENGIKTDGVLFVANSCEEGLGNLKGTRQLFRDFEGRIKNFISFDSFKLNAASDDCVGSHRYEVEVLTEGGHSYSAFGNKNAIAELSKIIDAIYSIPLPEKAGKKVTYNVGEISGGTSVNTIAQSARALCEYRSDDKELLAYMKGQFESIFEDARSDKVEVNVKMIGDRPCSSEVDAKEMQRLKGIIEEVVGEVIGEKIAYKSSSTDCNIPLSLGIPALCIGTYTGGGAHTREEWLDKASLAPGLEIAIKSALKFVKGE